jgi:predicted DNA-binding antitoxin AbrB/MazE fold protein
MTAMVIDAVHQKGIFRPVSPVSLPENALVNVLVESAETAVASGTERPSLFGAFPELAAITGDDIAWVKSLWQQGLDKQLRILSAADPRGHAGIRELSVLPDMQDRLIVTGARAREAALISVDRAITASGLVSMVW